MFLIIGFGLFITPLFGIVAFGIARMIQTIGKLATLLLFLSLPFYAVTVFTLMETATQMLENIMNHVNYIWDFSLFEVVSFTCFIILLAATVLSGMIHIKKCAN